MGVSDYSMIDSRVRICRNADRIERFLHRLLVRQVGIVSEVYFVDAWHSQSENKKVKSWFVYT